MNDVVSEAHDGALHDLGCCELFFRSLDFGESIGFSWVLFPFRHLSVLLQGQPCIQNSLSCIFQISPVSLLLHKSVEGHQVLNVLFRVCSVTQNSLLAFSFWRLDLNSFPVVIISKLLLGVAYRIGGR